MTGRAAPLRLNRSRLAQIVERSHAPVPTPCVAAPRHPKKRGTLEDFQSEAQWRHWSNLARPECGLSAREIARPTPCSCRNTLDTLGSPRAAQHPVRRDGFSAAIHYRCLAGSACFDIRPARSRIKEFPTEPNNGWLPSRWIWAAVAVGLYDGHGGAVGGAEFETQHRQRFPAILELNFGEEDVSKIQHVEHVPTASLDARAWIPFLLLVLLDP